MSIGIRTYEMPMKRYAQVRVILSCVIILSHLNIYAHDFSPESQLILQSDTLPGEINLPSDTLSLRTPLPNDVPNKAAYFSTKQLIIPGALIAIGTFGVYNPTFRKLDDKIKFGMDNLRGNCFFRVDDYIQYLPALTYLTFGAIGIKAKHSFKERVAAGVTSYIVMAALTNIGKFSFKEQRPDSKARNSFPSGHTATVFTGAELMREEYGLGIGIGAYTVATGVAFLRLYNGRHWLNDVIAGAGLGILSARVGYWMLPLYQRWFKWNNKPESELVMMPIYDYSNQRFSFNIVYCF